MKQIPVTLCIAFALLAVSGSLQAGYSFDFRCQGDTVQRIEPGGAADFFFALTNTGTETDGYRFDCREVQPVSGWSVIYCIRGLCMPPGTPRVESLAPGESDTTIHLAVYPDMTPGEEIANLRVTSLANPELVESIATHTLAGSAIEEVPALTGRCGLSIAPSPVRDRARIRWAASAQSGSVALALYDRAGICSERRVLRSPDRGELDWRRPSDLPDGVYILRLSAAGRSAWTRLVLVH